MWRLLAWSSGADLPLAARCLSALCRNWCKVQPVPCGSCGAEACLNRYSARW